MKSTYVVAASLFIFIAISAVWLSRPRFEHTGQGGDENNILAEVMQSLQTDEGRARVQTTYMTHCASCHGADLEGNAARGIPTLLSDHVKGPSGVLLIAQRIVQGGRGMPPFEGVLTKKNVVELTLWIRYRLSHAGGSAANRAGGPTTGSPGASSWRVMGTAELGPLAQKHKGAMLFIVVKRNPAMTGPPTVVGRFSADAPSVAFTLGPENVMMGSPPGVGDKLYVVARLDLDGNPMTQDGEPHSEIQEFVLKPKTNLSLKVKP
jgi:hypothetical protein